MAAKKSFVLVTRIVDGCIECTYAVHCRDEAGCEDWVDGLLSADHPRGMSHVGCIKVGDKIRRVF